MNETYCLNDAAWQEWEEFRRLELRKRIGPMAMRKQVQLLCSYPHPVQQQIIDQSIQNSWQGLFPPKQTQQVAASTTRSRSIMDDLTDTSWAQ